MKNKNAFPIKNGDKWEKELYRVFKELERHGRATFSYENAQKQRGMARTIGVRGKPLIEKNLLLPPALTRNKSINIVALPVNVEIKEKKTPGKTYFYFHRKYNIL